MSSRFAIRDRWTFSLAKWLLLAFFIFFGAAFIEGIIASPNDYTGIERVSAYLGFIPGAILGYYFQQERIQSAKEEAGEAKSRAERNKTTFGDSYEFAKGSNEEVEILKEQVRVLTRHNELLNSKVEQLEQQQRQ